MVLEDDVVISDNDEQENIVEMEPAVEVRKGKVNGLTEDEVGHPNSTSYIEDHDIRETLSDDSDKVQVSIFVGFK